MRPHLLALALSLAAFTVHADSADLILDVQTNSSVYGVQTNAILHAGDMLYINTFLRNAGPDTAHGVVVSMKVDGLPQEALPCPNGTCVLGDVKVTDYAPVPQLRLALPGADFTITFTATVTSSTPDPNAANNSATRTIIVKTAPHLLAQFRIPYQIDPGLPFDANLSLLNLGYATAHHVIVTADLPPGSGVVSVPTNCMATPARLTCTMDALSQTHGDGIGLATAKLRAPASYEGGDIAFEVAAHADEPDFLPGGFQGSVHSTLFRTFVITSTADDGSGSLRAAVLAANASCPRPAVFYATYVPCALQFNISDPSDRPWKTIRLKSPLPPVQAYTLRVDGATQTAFSGVANPDGPPIEITGGGTVDGDGLIDDGACMSSIANLTINGFLGNGISLRDRPPDDFCGTGAITNNFIGTDPTGTIAIPNFRGIGSVQSLSPLFQTRIQQNVVSGNIRSGMFMNDGSLYIYANRVGLKAHADDPLPNGASGIYLSLGTRFAEVVGNVIAFNHEMGLAINSATLDTTIANNRIWANGGLAIDDGLDGPSATVNTDTGPLAPPVLLSAVFNPLQNVTIISGTRSSKVGFELFVSDAIHADGVGDAQRLLSIRNSTLTPTDFVMTVSGDLRGQWITATATRMSSYQPDEEIFTNFKTTELSAPLQVQ